MILLLLFLLLTKFTQFVLDALFYLFYTRIHLDLSDPLQNSLLTSVQKTVLL